jgi:lipopolysaccharide/colanic/teichoic acid biosynthesis glycosyltransferase
MIQHAPGFTTLLYKPALVAERPPATHSPRLWGLSPRQLHDGYWRSRGVQCVRRGERQSLLRGAELFLLIDPDQFVLFPLINLADRLTWQNAAVTRVRLVDAETETYSERVVYDDDALVQRIERRYQPQVRGYSRAMLTGSRRIARIWMAARNRHEGWNRVRRSVAWERVDHCKCSGRNFLEGNPAQERQMLDALVACWPRPDQVIAGLQQVESDIWHMADEQVAPNVVCIGPLWLGKGATLRHRVCLVGPAWVEDQPQPDGSDDHSAKLREIAEIEAVRIKRQEAAPGISNVYPLLKRGFDVVASGLALLALLPLMTLISLAVYLESGSPLFFGHRRQGRGGRVFRCWKFRTMQHDAERTARELRAQNICDGPQVFIRNDPRVTRVGRFLRRWNLDELPQFWNVLCGDMSLVGPRPSPDDENQYCPAWRDLRLSVRPGITGLWQLMRTRQQGEDFQEWIKFDIQYVQQASFWTDLVILFKTARLVLAGRSPGAKHKAN